MSFAFRPVFLSKGVTSACFISAGTVAECNDILMIFASTGPIIVMLLFYSVVGQGSRARDFEGQLFTSRTIAIHCTADIHNLFGEMYSKTFRQIFMRVVAFG